MESSLLVQQKPFPDVNLMIFSMLTQRKARMNKGKVGRVLMQEEDYC